ncbi:uncharacterized protein LOC114543304 [Dendronephthya gigantea]|uniref:uncharacterized protein LOC114543304 n=1 Tax=Dendronephthya gigantea TaxID=151771 RepID=UPI0010693577|nr:uncharacterized protein LOC114543304 [Dendronephthya gigantea]
MTINKSSRENQTQLEISCEIFSKPGRYFIEYFIQGITKKFRLLTSKPFIVRSEKVHIEVKKNHTAFGGSLSAWLNSKQGRCKPFRGNLKLFWIKSSKEHVLVATKKIKKEKLESRSRSTTKTIARSHNISVIWGKYEITAQSKSIFPCSNSFVIKFSSPGYCDRTEDKIEMRSKVYNNVIDSQRAFHGFRSAFFSCAIFKKQIRDYCFYYTTKSSLTNERKVQATLCVPSKKRTGPQWTEWSKWSAWSSCTAFGGCGKGKKYRLRYCPLESYRFQKSDDTSLCAGKGIESKSCSLSPCEECKSCGCVFSMPAGTIISPKSRVSFITKERSNCHWFIEIAKQKTIKIWFDSLNLEKNASVVIRDGNSSNSEILKRITHQSQTQVDDIYSTSNIVSIWYENNGTNGNFQLQNSFGFQLSYSSVDGSKTPVSASSTRSQLRSRRLAKMTFIGILVILIVITFSIVAIIIIRIRRQRLHENATKTTLSQHPSSHTSHRPSSSRTSTACMSESTNRSFYEHPFSADESVNNNPNVPGVSSNHRAGMLTRMEQRTPVHVCPKCCSFVEQHFCECCHADSRRILNTHHGTNVENRPGVCRSQRVHSIIERRVSLSGASNVSQDFPERNYPSYL